MSRIYDAISQKEHSGISPTRDWHHSKAVLLDRAAADKPRDLPAQLSHGDNGTALLASSKSDEVPGVGQSLRAEMSTSERNISPEAVRHLSPTLTPGSRLVFEVDAGGLAAEQFRFLRRTLKREFPNGATILITSAAPQDGKSLTSLNLSACMGEAGKSTILVEADVRKPSLANALGVFPKAPGIEEVMLSNAGPLDALYYLDGFSFFAGLVKHAPADPSRVVGGPGMKQFIDWASEHFDWVVLDAPPVMPAADVMELLPLVDAVLLVVRAHRTPRELVERACELLGEHLYGVVFNEATMQSTPYYRYLNRYDSKYLHHQEETAK